MAKTRTNTPEFPDAFSLFKPSWQALLVNVDTFLLQALIPIGLGVLTALLLGASEQNPGAVIDILGVLCFMVTFVTASFSLLALIITEMESVKGRRISLLAVIRATLPHFWRLLGLAILGVIIVFVGFVLLIVPGLFALQRLLLAPYLLVDKRLGAIAAMKESYNISKDKKNSGAIWGVVGIIIAYNAVGFIPGWIPLTTSTAIMIAYWCAPAVRYLQVTKQSPSVKA